MLSLFNQKPTVVIQKFLGFYTLIAIFTVALIYSLDQVAAGLLPIIGIVVRDLYRSKTGTEKEAN